MALYHDEVLPLPKLLLLRLHCPNLQVLSNPEWAILFLSPIFYLVKLNYTMQSIHLPFGLSPDIFPEIFSECHRGGSWKSGITTNLQVYNHQFTGENGHFGTGTLWYYAQLRSLPSSRPFLLLRLHPQYLQVAPNLESGTLPTTQLSADPPSRPKWSFLWRKSLHLAELGSKIQSSAFTQ